MTVATSNVTGIKVGGTAVNSVESADFTFEMTEQDTTSLGDAATKSATTVQNVAFTITCKRDPTDAGQNSVIAGALAGTELTWTFTENASHHYDGKAKVTAKVSVKAKDLVVLTITGKQISDGNAWTYA